MGTAMEIAAIALVVAAVAMFLLSRVPAVRLAALCLLILSAAVGWLAWSDLGASPGP